MQSCLIIFFLLSNGLLFLCSGYHAPQAAPHTLQHTKLYLFNRFFNKEEASSVPTAAKAVNISLYLLISFFLSLTYFTSN